MRFIRLCSAVFVTVAAVSACHHRPPAASASRSVALPSTVPARPPSPSPPPSVSPTPATPLSEADLFRRKSLAELNAEHPLADAFFDYNQNLLRDDARQVLQHDAEWLAKWPQTIIRIDGHCDERGTAEYNLALGGRRAQVVRDYLASLGVRADRIQIRSLGREAPFCRDSGESCWSQNRRGHFEITGK